MSLVCVACSAGYYSALGGTGSCGACPVGTFSAGTGNAGCHVVQAGLFVDATNQTTATTCGAGTYRTDGMALDSCTTVPAGYQGVTGTNVDISTYTFVGTVGPTNGKTYFASSDSAETGLYNVYNATDGILAQSDVDATVILSTYGANLGSLTAVTASGLTQGFIDIQQCGANTYSAGGSMTCTPCGANSYSGPGSSSCQAATPGHYWNPVDNVIVPCAPGYYQPTAGVTATSMSTGCIAASAGHYAYGPEIVASVGGYAATSQQAATPGYYACGPVGTCQAASEQTPCAAGDYQDQSAQSSCIAAPAGSFTSSPGSANYTLCSAGSFTSTAGNTACTLAPAGSEVPTEGATYSSLCPQGSYSSADGAAACQPCDPGQTTSAAGSTNTGTINICAPCGPGNFLQYQVSCSATSDLRQDRAVVTNGSLYCINGKVYTGFTIAAAPIGADANDATNFTPTGEVDGDSCLITGATDTESVAVTVLGTNAASSGTWKLHACGPVIRTAPNQYSGKSSGSLTFSSGSFSFTTVY